MCGGFTCSKNALAALNILYIMVSFILIGVAVYGRASALVTNLPIISGILVCGVILILISILGLIAAVKHHQVLLFFYMIILFMLFLVQFSVACACLAVNREQQHQLAEQGWKRVPNTVKADVQKVFSCCGFEGDIGNSTTPAGNPPCLHEITTPCIHKLQNTINYAFKLCGGIGLFFSFTEVVALVVAFRYRNQHNPRAKLTSAILPLPSVVRPGSRPNMYYNIEN